MTTEVIKIYKSISSVPTPYVANAVYYVRVGTGVDIYISNSTGDAIFKHNVDSENSYISTVLAIGFPAVFTKKINISNTNCTINSVIDIKWNEDSENSSELDQFIFYTISNNGSFDVIIQHKDKESFGGDLNIKYKIQ